MTAPFGSAALWSPALLCGIGAMSWGAERASDLLDHLRRRWGIGELAAGTVLAFATGAPELVVNAVSAALRWPDIGLGTDLGANVPALPLILGVAWIAGRWFRRADAAGGAEEPTDEAPRPRIAPEVGQVQLAPYLLVVLLLAALTLPAARRGLRPIDALFLTAAFAAYLVCAIRTDRCRAGTSDGDDGDADHGSRTLAWRASLGVGAIALGGLSSVLAVRHLDEAFGLSDLGGGLFVTGLLCALPETVAAWSLGRKGQVTTAVSNAVADGISSMTLALVPLCFARAPVAQVGLYGLTLACLGLQLSALMLLLRRRDGEERAPVDGLRVVLPLVLVYAAYLGLALESLR